VPAWGGKRGTIRRPCKEETDIEKKGWSVNSGKMAGKNRGILNERAGPRTSLPLAKTQLNGKGERNSSGEEKGGTVLL